MSFMSRQSRGPTTQLREGAIYRDRSNNFIRLLSIHADYCVYFYVALANPRPTMQGSVTCLTKRDLFEANFIFVSECVEEWNGTQRRSSDTRD
jgi:hypothetical protein